MKNRVQMAFACVAMLLLSTACLEFGDPETSVETVVIVIEEGTSPGGTTERFADPSTELLSLPDPAPEANDPCSCDSQACLEQWVSKNLGCDVCVVLYCGSQRSHVCTRCDSTPGPGPGAQ